MNTLSNMDNELFERLQIVLKKQHNFIKKDDLRSAEKLSDQAAWLIDKLQKSHSLHQPEHKQQYEQLLKAYKDVVFMLETQQNQLQQRLKKIADGRKALQAYHA